MSISTRSTSGRLRISQNFEKNSSVISSINMSLNSEDWKVRLSTLEKISSGIIEECNANNKSSSLLSLIDCLCRVMTDKNLKVCQKALETLKEVIVTSKESLEPHLALIVNSLVVGLGSNSVSIRECSNLICKDILDNCGPIFSIVPFASAINIANPKAKSALLSVISQLLQPVHLKKPNLLPKLIIPIINKTIEDPHPEVRSEAENLTILMYEILGDAMLKNTTELKATRIKNIIQKSKI
jgi:CLASP N terminal